MLKLENINIKKGKKAIINQLNFTFERGNSYALIGPSGGGKTTLLNTIAGFETLKEGTVIFEGKDLKKVNHTLYYRDKLGYLFQNYGLVENMTVFQNIEMGIAFKKWRKKLKVEKMNTMLDLLNLSVDLKRKVSTLSGGEQQRIALARLILKSPELILADEPTGSLDPNNGALIMKHLLDMTNDNKTVIIATHDMRLAQSCDEVIDIGKFK
ncbi:ATP-binding cassette domain-containing protein [Staphylococcus simulans]